MRTTEQRTEGDSHAERRRNDDDWRAMVDRRLDDGAKTMQGLRDDLAENTEATRNIQTATAELVSLLNSFKGAFSVLEKLGKLARPLGYIAVALTACATFYTTLKGGKGGGG